MASFALRSRVDLARVFSQPRLVEAFVRNFEAVRSFYRHDPRQAECIAGGTTWNNRVAAFAGAWAERVRALDAPPAALRSIERLAAGEAIAVVTGHQQVALGGPLFVAYKIATAVAWARRLEAAGVPAVPLYWAVTDDDDRAEVDHVQVLDGEGELLRLPLSPPWEPGRPVGAMPLDDALRDALKACFARLRETEYTPAVRGLFAPDPADRTWTEWHTRLIHRLFGDQGVVVLEESLPSLAGVLESWWPAVVERRRALTQSVVQAGAALDRAGFPVQIRKELDACPFFVLREGRRHRVHCEGDHLEVEGERWSIERCRGELRQGRARLTPNVALRPAMMSALLPVAIYCGGPGELAYHAQLDGIYRLLDLPRPVFQLRLTATVVEPKIARLLDKHHLDPLDLHKMHDVEMFVAERLRGRHDLGRPERWRHIEQAVTSPLTALQGDVAAIDPTLSKALLHALEKIRYQVSHFETRLARSLARQEETLVRQHRRARGFLFPGRKLQERNLWFLHLVTYYGADWLPLLADLVDGITDSHLFIDLKPS